MVLPGPPLNALQKQSNSGARFRVAPRTTSDQILRGADHHFPTARRPMRKPYVAGPASSKGAGSSAQRCGRKTNQRWAERIRHSAESAALGKPAKRQHGATEQHRDANNGQLARSDTGSRQHLALNLGSALWVLGSAGLTGARRSFNAGKYSAHQNVGSEADLDGVGLARLLGNIEGRRARVGDDNHRRCAIDGDIKDIAGFTLD